MKHVLIAGSSGFIGSNIDRYLLENEYKVLRLESPKSLKSNSNKKTNINNVQERINSEGLKFDLVINASQIYSRESQPSALKPMHYANVELPQILGKIAEKCGSKFVHFSTYLEFSSLDSAYVSQKREISEWLESQRETIEIQRIILGDTFGFPDARDKVLNHIARTGIRRQVINLGSPKTQLRLLSILDLISNLFSLQHQGTYNFIPVNTVNLEEIISIAEKVFDCKYSVAWSNLFENSSESLNTYKKVASTCSDFKLIHPIPIQERIHDFFTQYRLAMRAL
jgi:nucleoside-diphosphate-sugar epimerase